MDKLKLLERAVGGRWTGVVFGDGSDPKGSLPKEPMRLCEAVKESYRRPVVLTKDFISCPGALRSLGWSTNEDNMIAEKIAETTGAKVDIVRKLVADTPGIEAKDSITIGKIQRPDIAITYAQPEAAMNLVRQWQLIHGTDLNIPVSTVMSVCGSVVARAHVTGKICMSFGCPDSREHGGIGRDRLVIGVPAYLVQKMF
jgi:uncharacterized protein (DUF169 family)